MWLSGPPFSRPSTRYLALRVRGARRAMCLALHPSRAQQCLCNIAHRKVYYIHTTGGQHEINTTYPIHYLQERTEGKA